MTVSKEEYLAWKADKVTKKVFAAFQAKVNEGMEELSHVAGENPVSDSRRVGKLDGLRTFIDLTYYDLESEEE